MFSFYATSCHSKMFALWMPQQTGSPEITSAMLTTWLTEQQLWLLYLDIPWGSFDLPSLSVLPIHHFLSTRLVPVQLPASCSITVSHKGVAIYAGDTQLWEEIKSIWFQSSKGGNTTTKIYSVLLDTSFILCECCMYEGVFMLWLKSRTTISVWVWSWLINVSVDFLASNEKCTTTWRMGLEFCST